MSLMSDKLPETRAAEHMRCIKEFLKSPTVNMNYENGNKISLLQNKTELRKMEMKLFQFYFLIRHLHSNILTEKSPLLPLGFFFLTLVVHCGKEW